MKDEYHDSLFEAEWQKKCYTLGFWSKTILAIGYYKIKSGNVLMALLLPELKFDKLCFIVYSHS